MFKPANLRKFITPAIHKKPTTKTIYGVDQPTFVNAEKPNLRGEFKQKTSNEVTANGVVVVVTTTTYATWYKADLVAGDQLVIGGETYEIKGRADNVEARKRYMVCNLELVTGGA